MDVVNDGGPFQLVLTSKVSKKPCTDEPDQGCAKHKFETPIRILFKKMPKACSQFNVPSNIKQVLLAMMKVNPSLSVLSLDKKLTYHPSQNDFPVQEEAFKTYFLVHPSSTKPSLHRTVTIGCVLWSLKTIKDIKFAKG